MSFERRSRGGVTLYLSKMPFVYAYQDGGGGFLNGNKLKRVESIHDSQVYLDGAPWYWNYERAGALKRIYVIQEFDSDTGKQIVSVAPYQCDNPPVRKLTRKERVTQ